MRNDHCNFDLFRVNSLIVRDVDASLFRTLVRCHIIPCLILVYLENGWVGWCGGGREGQFIVALGTPHITLLFCTSKMFINIQ